MIVDLQNITGITAFKKKNVLNKHCIFITIAYEMKISQRGNFENSEHFRCGEIRYTHKLIFGIRASLE